MSVETYSRTGRTYFCWTEQRALILAAALRTTKVAIVVTYTRRWPGWTVETYVEDPSNPFSGAVDQRKALL